MSSLTSDWSASPAVAQARGLPWRVMFCAAMLVLATLLDFAGNPDPLASLPAYGLQIVLAGGLFCSRRWAFEVAAVLFALNIVTMVASTFVSPATWVLIPIHAGVLLLLLSAWPHFFPNSGRKKARELLRDWIDGHPLSLAYRLAPLRLRLYIFYLLATCAANLAVGFYFSTLWPEMAGARDMEVKDFELFGFLPYMSPVDALSASLVCLALAWGLMYRSRAAYLVLLYLSAASIVASVNGLVNRGFLQSGLWIDLALFALLLSLRGTFFHSAPHAVRDGRDERA